MEVQHRQYESKNCYKVKLGKVVIGFSYQTPVALWAEGLTCRVPNNTYSRTTNRHMRVLNATGEEVTEDELEQRIEQALAKQAFNVISKRLDNGYTSTNTTSQSPSWADSGSAVLRGAGTAVEAG